MNEFPFFVEEQKFVLLITTFSGKVKLVFMTFLKLDRSVFQEKVAHGICIAVGLLAIPTYISLNIKNYRGPPE